MGDLYKLCWFEEWGIFTRRGVVLRDGDLYKKVCCCEGWKDLWKSSNIRFFVSGTFARIYGGVLTGPKEGQQQSVIVKTVSQLASAEQVNLLLIESSTLRDLTHKNLLPISAVCLEDEKQPLVMFPFMNRGNLKLFLKKSRSPEGGSKVSLTM